MVTSMKANTIANHIALYNSNFGHWNDGSTVRINREILNHRMGQGSNLVGINSLQNLLGSLLATPVEIENGSTYCWIQHAVVDKQFRGQGIFNSLLLKAGIELTENIVIVTNNSLVLRALSSVKKMCKPGTSKYNRLLGSKQMRVILDQYRVTSTSFVDNLLCLDTGLGNFDENLAFPFFENGREGLFIFE